jgi:MFS transporter, putative metabolite:H+ symporter
MKKYSYLFSLTFLVCALGYFVDIYDLVLFGIVRIPSLRSLGIPEEELLSVGVYLINCQMAGLLLGGIVWGILGDKRGRVSILLGSILLYSLANIANAFVANIEVYALLRLLAGVGLAGEVGAAITLISESMKPQQRGMGTAVLTSFGVLGAMVAGLVGDFFSWQVAYFLGGILGILLLLLRMAVKESVLFAEMKETDAKRGDLRILWSNRSEAAKYVFCVLMGIPIWFVVGILITFSPEIAKSLQVVGDVAVSRSIMFCYFGLCFGDFFSGIVSQILKSRKKSIFIYLVLMFLLVCFYCFFRAASSAQFYVICMCLGFFTGYWATFITLVAESFGTNIRATAVTTISNFVRGAVIPLTLMLQLLSNYLSLSFCVFFMGLCVFSMSLFALRKTNETFGKNLDYIQ